MTEGQRLAVDQLHAVEAAGGGVLRVLSVTHSSSANEWVTVEVSISCAHHQVRPGGLALETQERFIIDIPPGFPFNRPGVWTPHTRFAGHPHVLWQRHLCLYQAPSAEWDASDGMYGFLERLESWLDQAAQDELDPTGAPLHPPITYRIPGAARRSVVVRADTPVVGMEPWTGFARLDVVSESRVDIIGWSGWDAAEFPRGPAAAILLTDPLPPEFPSTVCGLIEHLTARSIALRRLLGVMKIAAILNEEGRPLYVVVGAPMRGIRGSKALHQHLAVWSVDPVVADALRLALRASLGNELVREIGEKVEQLILQWAEGARVDWCNVMEDRPEIVVRRDHAAPTRRFAGKTISLWGCGALGGPIAEFLARVGVKKLFLRDNGVVTPGLLVRQVFEDQDIGRPKANALADRLRRVRPDLEIEVDVTDILDGPLEAEDWTDGADLIIDTTASEAVLAKLELRRWTKRVRPIPVAAMAISHRADRGLVVLAHAVHVGGPGDVCRRAKLEVLTRPGFQRYADEFWPQQRRPIFQPEPGCSEPTFVGATADVTALAGMMLNAVAMELGGQAMSATATTNFFTLPHAPRSPDDHMTSAFRWEADRVSDDPHSGYQIRIAEPAWREIVAWVERSRRVAGPTIETGGLLFGERDDAVRVIWVTEASGPPPDSEASDQGFVCGVRGVAELNAEKRQRTHDSVRVVGMWHAHPDSAPLPSPTDAQAMAAILEASPAPSARSLLLIIGHTTTRTPIFATFEFSRSDVERMKTGGLKRMCAMQPAPRRPKSRRVGLTLSGGGSRAIAFHLGCLRALYDRGVLEQVDVISSVSGGSLIGAMYAYSEEPFEAFDRRVLELLRRGLVRGITRRVLSPRLLPAILGTLLTAGVAGKGADALRFALGVGGRMLGVDDRRIAEKITRIQPPLRRRVSRTTAFEATLRDEIFGDRRLPSARRSGVHVVINACELRTGSAFRFGSRESGCWRFGRVLDNEISVALAVAASAAYPVLLPAIDRELVFVNRAGRQQTVRVLLTDGGIFDNLGVTCMEPGRSEAVSYNVYSPEYIVACDAGAGLLSDESVPYWWPTRMVRAFESVFRKVQNGAYRRLHTYVAAGTLRGFVLSYLGQRDDRLPYRPPDLVPRSEVVGYPTDFSPMPEDMIVRLTARGEILTRLLLERYCPEL